MTKIIRSTFVLAIAALACAGLTACDDDTVSGVTNTFVVGNDG